MEENKEIFFEVVSKLNVKIRTTKNYWAYLITKKHPVMKGEKNKVVETLFEPDEIRQSSADKDVYLYYKMFDKFYCVVVKHMGMEGFLITAYPTHRIKEGEVIWKK